MTVKRVYIILISALISVGVAGCKVDGKDESLLGAFDNTADEYSCKMGVEINKLLSVDGQAAAAKEADIKPCLDAYKDNAELRLLRAHLIAAVMIRYGAARIEDYSKEKAVDATRLNLRIHNVLLKLDEAVKLYKDTKNAPLKNTAVIKADLYEDFVALAAEALSPTLSELRSLAFASPIERASKGGAILKGALEDALYKAAYAAWMKDLRLYVVSNGSLDTSKQKEAWAVINEHLVQQCKRVASLADIDPATMDKTPANKGCKVDWQ